MTDKKILFYTHPFSRGRSVRWLLEEAGCAYEHKIIPYGPEMNTPEYLAINPMGKVPAIRHRGQIVTETAAICAYIADAFPQAGLAPPPGDPQRAAFYRWLFFVAGPLEYAFTNYIFRFSVPEDKQPMVGYGSYVRTLEVLDAQLRTHDYVAGPRFSAADIPLGMFMSMLMKDGGEAANKKSFAAYSERVNARAAAKRAMEIDNELMKDVEMPGQPA